MSTRQAEGPQQAVGAGGRGREDGQPELLLGRLDESSDGICTQAEMHQRVDAGKVERSRGVHDPVARDAADLAVVLDLERAPVGHLEAFGLEVVDDLLRPAAACTASPGRSVRRAMAWSASTRAPALERTTASEPPVASCSATSPSTRWCSPGPTAMIATRQA